jgi:hypothetical protein
MNPLKKQRVPSVLGLALHGSQLEGVVLRRTNGSLQVQKKFSATLALSPLTADPELAGREIKNHLEQAGIRERRCVVAVPLSASLNAVVDIPELPEEDVESFLAIEAERAFPYGADALLTSTYRFNAGAKARAILVAFQRSELTALDQALRSARLKPLSFLLGTAALQPPGKASSDGVVALVISESTVDLQVTAAGGIVALRSLHGLFDTEGTQKTLSADLVAREIRITLGQLPAEFRDAVKRARVYGRGDVARRFIGEFSPKAKALGLEAKLVEHYEAGEFEKQIPGDAEVSDAFSAAAKHLTGTAAPFEFLPPRVTAWRQFAARFSSGKLVWAGGAAGAVALIVLCAFLYQQWQLSHLNSQWSGMQTTVRDLEDLQQEIRRFRPWFDESFSSLTILRKVTEAFPAEGAVTAKTLEIRELSSVTCSGTARDNQSLLRVLDQLRAANQISNLKVDQVRGKTPMQFTFNFQWSEGGTSGR